MPHHLCFNSFLGNRLQLWSMNELAGQVSGMELVHLTNEVITLELRQNGHYFPDNILMVSCQKGPIRHAYTWRIGPFWQDTPDFQCISLYVNCCVAIEISLKYVPKGVDDNKSGLVRIMAWHQTGDKPLPGPTFIKPDQRNPWIKDQLWNDLLSTILHLQLPNFVSCGRDKPSHMTQNLVTVGVKL